MKSKKNRINFFHHEADQPELFENIYLILIELAQWYVNPSLLTNNTKSMCVCEL